MGAPERVPCVCNIGGDFWATYSRLDLTHVPRFSPSSSGDWG